MPIDDFDWDGLEDKDVEPCVRGNMLMISMERDHTPLDMCRVELLIDRLQAGIKRLKGIETSC
jgi:hypothetical protein